MGNRKAAASCWCGGEPSTLGAHIPGPACRRVLHSVYRVLARNDNAENCDHLRKWPARLDAGEGREKARGALRSPVITRRLELVKGSPPRRAPRNLRAGTCG